MTAHAHSSATTIRCKLCGFAFDPAALACHTSCPLHQHCNVICCPNCGYQVVDEQRSQAAQWLARWWRPRKRQLAEGEQVALTDAPVGVETEICALLEDDPLRLARLSIYGLAPGCRVCLLQRHPSCIVRTGETELALSREIVAAIQVRAIARDDIPSA